ncbi:hypothetical protein [uncultured Phascolarctobacterium sp.]|uniref:hypothetical protein n=1 Tax=uncultured Phascolarctobacterium sp. TaxID=512296 RepID=UPI0025F2D96D|nr:hypothetical protein [uncultured Phascolarctobacterium sp.]
MEDTISIVGWISRGIFRGQIASSAKGNEFEVITFDGESSTEWQNVSLTDIFERCRFNKNLAVVRIMLFADAPIEAPAGLADLSLSPKAFSWHELITAMKEVKDKPYIWQLDGVPLNEEIRKGVPNSLAAQDKDKVGYIYSFPKIKCPEVPSASQTSQPADSKQKQEQKLAEKKETIRLESNNNSVMSALRKIAEEPKN